MNEKIQLVIPAAGNGTRFKSAGYKTIKPLIPVFNVPMINWVIANFPINFLSKVIIISKYGDEIHELTKEWFKENKINLEFLTIPGETEGPADTVSRVRESIDLDAPMVVANSDQYVNADLLEFLQRVCSGGEKGTILSMSATSSKWSYIGRDNNGSINKVVEKVEISDEATVGIYGWSKAKFFFSSFEKMRLMNDRTNGEFYVAPTYNYLISEGLRVGALNIGNIESNVFGLGTPEDLNLFLRNKDMANKATSILKSTS